MNFYSKLFYPEAVGWGPAPEKQTAATCFDFNFINQLKINKRWRLATGGGVSQKGWMEESLCCYNDIATQPQMYKALKDKVSLVYLNLQVGLSYDIVSFKKFTFNLGQLITPEYAFSPNPEYFRTIVVSTRTNLSLQYNLSKKIGLQLTPFFQTALERYNKKVSNPQSSDWTPYGYGATFGLLW